MKLLDHLPAYLHYPMRKLVRLVDQVNNFMAPDAVEADSPTKMARGPILFGGWLVILVFGFLGLWSALAPLASAAVAPGKVILSGSKKTVQHLEGGIVDEIMVREGQTVRAGQPLVRLNENQARARFNLYRKQYWAASAAEARLVAERDGAKQITYPKVVLDNAQDPDLAEFIQTQDRLFKSRKQANESQVDILQQKKAQYQEEIGGLKAQIASASEQINLLQEEINAVRALLAKGNAQRPRLLALQREQANLEGQRGEYQAMISRAEQAIAEADLQIINLETEFQNNIAAEMKETVERQSDLQEQLNASTDIIKRITINAPLSGIVTDLQIHTEGGVIRAGDKIMDIVPIDQLLVEAHVSPQDIDVVHSGMEARVRLTAYKARNVPPLEGQVQHISADRFENEQTGQAYYLARIEISDEELANHENVQLTPGMPADALIITGERTLLSYMITPISDSFRKAFVED